MLGQWIWSYWRMDKNINVNEKKLIQLYTQSDFIQFEENALIFLEKNMKNV